MSFSSTEKLFAASAFLGIGLAVAGSIVAPAAPPVTGDTVARVNGHTITTQDYDQALKAYAGGSVETLSAAEKQAVLDGLIDERLLIDRAFALGLPERDAAVRKAILAAMQEFIVAAVPEPDDATLRAYYAAHAAAFTPPTRFGVRTLYVADSRDRPRLGRIEAGLKDGTAFDALAAEVGQVWDAAPPHTALPARLLGKWLGPSGLAALPAMQAGETLGPFEAGQGVYYLHLDTVQAAEVPAFEDVRTQVLADWRRAANAAAVKAYVDALRTKAEIAVRKEAAQ